MDREMLTLTRARLDEEVVRVALEMGERRVAGEPLQYITGIAGFRRIEVAVGPGVLIPRPETEGVVDHALAHLPPDGTLVDVGTGSGAIALAVKDERADARVLATEVSDEALTWVRSNVSDLELDVEVVACDLLSGLPDDLRGAIDVIVSNPPYVATGESSSLPVDVVDHEPHEALFAGVDGTAVIERLAAEARGWLCSGGWLVLEIGESLGERTSQLLAEDGYIEISVEQDLNGRDRIVMGRTR